MYRTSSLIVLALLGAGAAPLVGQESSLRPITRLDVAVGVGDSRYTAAASMSRHFALFGLEPLRLGFGLRYTAFVASDLEFTTADADLIDQGRREPVDVPNPQTHSVNAAIYATYRVSGPVEAGFNIDVVGLGFGPSRTVHSRSADPSSQGDYEAGPTRFNLLEGGDSDHGTLNSEFYVALWLGARTAVRAGASHFVAEYTTQLPLGYGNERFRRFQNLVFVSLVVRR